MADGNSGPNSGFSEQTLRQAIVNTWGPAGAHIDVYDHLLAEYARLRDLVERQAEYVSFLGERLNAHEGLAWARTGQAAAPEHVAEGERLRAALAEAEERGK